MDTENENPGSNGCFRRASSYQNQPRRKPGGWKTMPYILGYGGNDIDGMDTTVASTGMRLAASGNEPKQRSDESQLGFLIMSLCFLAIGSGGIRPCSVPFGVDQFDTSTEKGRKGLGSFYNWYYATFSIILVFTVTVVVCVQDSVSWVLGYAIPTLLMFGAIVLFFLGTRVYVYMKPEGSVFTWLAQVVVATYKKRKLKLPSHVL